MKKRLQRILSILCVLALAIGCWTVAVSEEGDAKQASYVITVTWMDEDNYDGLRPDSINASIGGTAVTLNKGNGWTAIALAPEGSAWSVPDVAGYNKSVSGTEVAAVTYRHPVARTQLTASVTWNDDGNAAGLRPASMKIRLLADGKPFGAPQAATRANGWTVVWNDLPLTRKGSSEPITYAIEPAQVLSNYITVAAGSTLTNTLKAGTLTVDASAFGMPEGDTGALSVTVSGPDPRMPVTLSYSQAAGGYSFGKVVEGAYLVKINNDGAIPDGFRVDAGASKPAAAIMVKNGEAANLSVSYGLTDRTLAANDDEEEEDPWANIGALEIMITGPDPSMPITITYADFVEGRYELDNLVPGEYAVVELNPEGLVKAYTLSSDSITAITVTVAADGTATASLFNRYEPETTPEPEQETVDIPVSKAWADENNKDGNRPSSITVRLYADGVLKDTITLTDGMGWYTVFTGLPRYAEDGHEIVYTVGEDEVPLYTASVTGTSIVNVYSPETTSTTITKVWDDNDDAAGKRPDSVGVTLQPVGKSYLLTPGNGWTITVTGLPTQIQGKKVTYSWTEQQVPGYKTTVSEDGSVITNHYVAMPKTPEGQKKPQTPQDVWYTFEDYDTALGVNVIINHVGDCFD